MESSANTEVYDLSNIVVVKIGSSTLVDTGGEPDYDFVAQLCDQLSELNDSGYHMIVVSSGAVAAGFRRLGLARRPHDMPTLQASAAAGQAALIETYADALARHGLSCAQLLLTRRDLVDRHGYLNARNTLGRLISLGCIPIINENDTVSVAEFSFGDNDMLGAIVSALVNADQYVILSDVDGLYTANPELDPSARLLPKVKELTDSICSMAGDSVSGVGTGGMSSKLRAAKAARAAGIQTVICRGRRPHALVDVVNGRGICTRIMADPSAGEGARKLWIGLAEVPRGSLTLDEGAEKAVLNQGASILPVGITSSTGEYDAGDVVNVLSPAGSLIGRGISQYDSSDMKRILGLRSDVIARFMPNGVVRPAIHRDELLVF